MKKGINRFCVILILAFLSFIGNAQEPELNNYRWEITPYNKHKIILPNAIKNFAFFPLNLEGVSFQVAPNIPNQLWISITKSNVKEFQLDIIEDVLKKEARVQSFLIVIKDDEGNPLTLRFSTDQDIINEIKRSNQNKINETKPPIVPTTASKEINTPESKPQPVVNSKQAQNPKVKTNNLDDLIANADKYFKEQNFKEAEIIYKQINDLDPGNPHIISQLEKINESKKMSDDLANKEEKYAENFKKAEEYKNTGQWTYAKYYFKEALKYAKNPKSVKDQLALVEAKEKEQKEKEAKFNTFKQKAELASQNKDFETSITNWEAALKIFPDDNVAISQLGKAKTDLQNKITEELEIQARNEKIKIENEFQKNFAIVDLSVKNKDFIKARNDLSKATEIIPGDPRIEQKIAEIDIAEKKEMEAIAMKEKQLQDQQFNLYVSNSQKLLREGNFSGAIAQLELAQGVKPADPFPANQIKAVIAAEANAEEESERKKKDAALAAIKSEYNKQILLADKALANNKLDEAEKGYLAANKIMPEDPYPEMKLKAIEEKRKALMVKMENDKKRQEELRIIDEKYNTAISNGDVFIANNEFDKGILSYEEALSIKPKDHVAIGKINIANKKKVDVIEQSATAKKVAAEKSRDSLNSLGDAAWLAGDFYKAKEQFTKSIELYPESNQQAKSQLRYVEGKIQEIEAKELIIRNDELYASLMVNAEKAFKNGEYESALESANQAAVLKPEESRPRAIVNQLSDPDERKRLESNANRNLSNKLVDSAQLQFKNGKYQETVKLLDEAKKLWPQNNRLEYLYIQSNAAITGKPANQKTIVPIKMTFEEDSSNTQTIIRKGSNPNSIKQQVGYTTTGNQIQKESENVSASIKKEMANNSDSTTTIANTESKEPIKVKVEDKLQETINETVNISNPSNEKNINGLIQQNNPVPFTKDELATKFPGLNFADAPHGQKFTMEYYSDFEKSTNLEKCNSLKGLEPNLPVKDSIDQVKVHLDNLSFGVYNAYFRINISNYHSQKDFPVGYMMLSIERKNGETTNFEPSFISDFPVVKPGNSSTLFYVSKQIFLKDEDKLIFNLFDRKTNTRFKIELPGEIYNKEYDK